MSKDADSAAALPTFQSLYWNDAIFGRAVTTAKFLAFVGAGFWALGGARSGPPPSMDSSEYMMQTLVGAVPLPAFAVVLVALIIAIWRWRYVRTIFAEGAIVQGTVVKLHRHEWQDSSTAEGSLDYTPTTRHAYYITFRYTVNGEKRTVKRKLPNSGYVFGIREGGPVELMVHESRPHRPLIRPVYLHRH